MTWAYGAGFDRRTEEHVPEAGLDVVESRFVVDDLVKFLTLRRSGSLVAQEVERPRT
jgi:hypothetical protein